MNDQCEHFDGCVCEDDYVPTCLTCDDVPMSAGDGWFASYCDPCNQANIHATSLTPVDQRCECCDWSCKCRACVAEREADDAGFREVAPAVSLVKPFPKGVRVLYQPTFGHIRAGYVLGQVRQGEWLVKLDGREWPVRGGTPQLKRV